MTRNFGISYLTTAPLGAPDALLLAHKLGYCAIGIRVAPLTPGGDFSPLGENPVLLRQTKDLIKDTGVAVFDVEGVRLDERTRGHSFERLLAVSGELGAKAISVIGDDPDEPRLVESFKDLCDAAAPYYLEVTLEFMPYSKVPDANSALRILRQVQRPNARILVDFLHVSRSSTTRQDLASIPPQWLSHAQLCDAPAQMPKTREELIHTARRGRLLPGSGGIDIRGMLQALPDDLPLCIEVPNAEQLALHGAEEWARRSLSATRQTLGVESSAVTSRT
jgi:sugar phosphate isomerase/epimerase